MYYGVRIDDNNTCFVREYDDVEKALNECISVSKDLEDAVTVSGYLNENLSECFTYFVDINGMKKTFE